MGLVKEAIRIRQVAEYNFPNSVWTTRLVELIADPEKPAPKGVVERSLEAVTSVFD